MIRLFVSPFTINGHITPNCANSLIFLSLQKRLGTASFTNSSWMTAPLTLIKTLPIGGKGREWNGKQRREMKHHYCMFHL
jgi:hypothetical protein